MPANPLLKAWQMTWLALCAFVASRDKPHTSCYPKMKYPRSRLIFEDSESACQLKALGRQQAWRVGLKIPGTADDWAF
ncbi:hypothetical protein B0T21DRAFT_355298 [Apiosordaria backusii]|uniref:Secreted protein n=1 Tax=Apiosordaria backusii TaxID=314023 RepID=A0AA40K6K1_9PEZI|nr:hypothetical protein B0T21DRAFT_355298 [Apiosordaria backusii]